MADLELKFKRVSAAVENVASKEQPASCKGVTPEGKEFVSTDEVINESDLADCLNIIDSDDQNKPIQPNQTLKRGSKR